jgi:hypothetical protein
MGGRRRSERRLGKGIKEGVAVSEGKGGLV